MYLLRKSNILGFCLLMSAVGISLFDYHKHSPSIIFKEDENYEDSDKDIDFINDKTTLDNRENEESIKTIDAPKQVTSKDNKSVIQITTKRGDSLISIMNKAGINNNDAYNAASAIAKIFKIKYLKPGLVINLKLNNNRLEELIFSPNYKFEILVKKYNNNYKAKKIEIPLKKVIKNISGTISPSAPSYSLKKCGISNSLANDMLIALRQVVSIRSARTPIDFEVLYENLYDKDGHSISKPKLLYIAATINGHIKRVYKFNNNGTFEYIDSKGTKLNSTKGKAMFIQPVAYSKITSRFGTRKHPISGKIKGHTGVDFKTSIGTPIRATASGTVSKASYFSGYGLYICLNHSTNLKTAYAHLSRIIVKNGQFVKQGQIIGYSGNSGYSTGPHLHYEVIKNGKFIDPLSYIPRDPEKLVGQQLLQFNNFKKKINLQIASLSKNDNKIY